MKHVSTLLEKLNISPDIIEAISAENLPDDFDSKVANYTNSRNDYFKATPEFKALVKAREDATYKGSLGKHTKRINEALGLGLTNAQLDEIHSIEDFAEMTKVHLSEKEKKWINSNDTTLKADLEKYKTDYSKAINESTRLLSEIELVKTNSEIDKNSAIDLYKAESLFHQIVSNDKDLPGSDGQEFTLSMIKDKIFSSYKVKGDGTIYALDGTSAIHPEKQTVMTKLLEIYDYSKNKANLIKRSNAGSGAGAGGGTGSAGGISPAIAAKMAELQRAKERN